MTTSQDTMPAFEAYLFSNLDTLPIKLTRQAWSQVGSEYHMTETVLGEYDTLIDAVHARAAASQPQS